MEIKYTEKIVTPSHLTNDWYDFSKPFNIKNYKSISICCDNIMQFPLSQIISFKFCPFCGEPINKVKIEE